MKLPAVLLSIVILSGCNDFRVRDGWVTAASDYTCTMDQMDKALQETKDIISIDTEKMFPRYWYGSAIIRNCTLKDIVK